MTEWRPIPGFESFYEISDEGAVRSFDRVFTYGTGTQIVRPGRLLRPIPIGTRHLRVRLYGDGVNRKHLIHRLVLMAFVGPPAAGQEACHNNDVPTDNRLSNLRWDTRSANAYDAIRNGNRVTKTHCKRGHPLSGENLYEHGGHRHCRACNRLWDKEHG